MTNMERCLCVLDEEKYVISIPFSVSLNHLLCFIISRRTKERNKWLPISNHSLPNYKIK